MAEEMDRRKLDELPARKRWLAVVSIIFIITLVFPFATGQVLIEEIANRFRCPWRIEIFQEGKWLDMGGYRSIDEAVYRLQRESEDTSASWRIRRGNEIFPGEIIAS